MRDFGDYIVWYSNGQFYKRDYEDMYKQAKENLNKKGISTLDPEYSEKLENEVQLVKDNYALKETGFLYTYSDVSMIMDEWLKKHKNIKIDEDTYRILGEFIYYIMGVNQEVSENEFYKMSLEQIKGYDIKIDKLKWRLAELGYE